MNSLEKNNQNNHNNRSHKFAYKGVCPVCGSFETTYNFEVLGDIVFNNYHFNDNKAYRSCECKECGATWRKQSKMFFLSQYGIEPQKIQYHGKKELKSLFCVALTNK